MPKPASPGVDLSGQDQTLKSVLYNYIKNSWALVIREETSSADGSCFSFASD